MEQLAGILPLLLIFLIFYLIWRFYIKKHLTIDESIPSIINCNDCKKEISKNSYNCPHCGALGLKALKDKKFGKSLFSLSLISFALYFLISLNMDIFTLASLSILFKIWFYLSCIPGVLGLYLIFSKR